MAEAQNVKPQQGTARSAAAPARPQAQSAVKLGIDLGTNTSVIAASSGGSPLELQRDIVTTVVGFPKPGILPGILPRDAEALFGEEALEYRLHLDLKWPLKEGFVDDVETAALFTRHLRQLVDPFGVRKLWGVVGAPANASPERQKALRAAFAGVLERILIVPEPFLAAMGLREDENFKKEGSGDPTKHSLIVDIGAGTTDLCLVRGYFPTAEDQISFSKAGDYIDARILAALERRYPDLKVTPVTVTRIKEQHAFVTGHPRDAKVKVYVDGRPLTLDFADILREACDEIVPMIIKGIRELFTRCDSDSIVDVMQNIIVTGGGSQIHGLCERIEELLHKDGYDLARAVRPADYKRLVARGALRIAENVRDDQWQVAM